MAVEAVVGRVQLPAHEPLRVGRFPLQDAVPLFLPGELASELRPEGLAIGIRFRPDGWIVDVRVPAELLRGWELASLLEQSVDFVGHSARDSNACVAALAVHHRDTE